MIAFSLLEFPYTGARIGSTILEKLREYEIENKIISITLDNASTNNVTTDLLKPAIQLDLNGSLFQNRCTCHIINLIVQVEVKSIRDDLESIRWIVGYIFCSPSRKQWWRDICVNLGLRPKKILQDVKHR